MWLAVTAHAATTIKIQSGYTCAHYHAADMRDARKAGFAFDRAEGQGSKMKVYYTSLEYPDMGIAAYCTSGYYVVRVN